MMDSQVSSNPPGMLEVRLAALREELGRFRDPQERFAFLVERARIMPALPTEERLDGHLVEGCLVRIWFVPEHREGRAWFRCDSDAVSLKAMGGLLCDFYSGATAGEIVDQGPAFLSEFKLLSTLAESRRRTVWRIREKIRGFAERISAG